MTNEHLDDEAISAYLDDEATAREAAHVESCDACGARLTQLRAAAAAIAIPPPSPDAAGRDAAIAAAIDRGRATDNVVPFRRRLPQWLPAAAAVLVVVAMIPVLANLTDRGADDGDVTAAGDSATEEQLETMADDADGTSAFAGPVTVDGGYVGDVGAGDVRGLVERALDAPQPEAVTGSERSASDGDDAGGAGAGGGSDAAPVDGQSGASPAPCEDRARADFDDLGALRYRALGTVDGTEVSILAFDLLSERPRLRVLVLSVDSCVIELAQEIAVEP